MTVRTALIVARSPACRSVVGGVPLMVRAVRTLRAAGFTEVRTFPDAAGAAAGPVEATTGAEPVLVISGDVLFESDGLAPLLAASEPGRVRAGPHPGMEPGDLRAAVCPRADLPRLLAALRDGGCTLADALGRLGRPTSPPVSLERGLFLPAGPTRPAAALTDALLAHLAGKSAATDGYLTTLLDRHVSRAITRRLLAWPVTPNQVTLVSLLIGLGGALGLATVSYAARLAGVLALFVSSVLDGVDGELARARLEQSRFGARLDLAGDYTVNFATFVALGIGLARQGLPPAGLWAVAALVAGVAAAMAAVHALVIRPAPGVGLQDSPVSGVVEKIAGRDYVYLLLVAALVGHLEWFVYAAAAGAWGFVAALLGYWMYERRKAASARPIAATSGSD